MFVLTQPVQWRHIIAHVTVHQARGRAARQRSLIQSRSDMNSYASLTSACFCFIKMNLSYSEHSPFTALCSLSHCSRLGWRFCSTRTCSLEVHDRPPPTVHDRPPPTVHDRPPTVRSTANGPRSDPTNGPRSRQRSMIDRQRPRSTATNGPRSTANGPRSTANGPRSTATNGPRSTANGPRSTANGPRSTANGPRRFNIRQNPGY
ncbi:hypothetical protein D5F01_LYC03463 [Larimichthys crocea]|uniref:Trimeric autotransporter adhesin YadA-like head domain-containing protein n=1 Tax=Larimichthys crocea TaxID=215358 RepID=A0A6G0J5R4_LARCR|nr:hypothetical protein D5F01_LYC03463 [Larimichthys crocea]